MFLDLAATSSSLISPLFKNHLDKLHACKEDDALFSVHVYLLISTTELPYFQRKKERTIYDCHLLECIIYA